MGDAHMAEGDKLASSGLFKRPNWEGAAACYVKAGAAYRVAHNALAAKGAYQKAAQAWAQAGSTFNAAKHVELAAGQCKGEESALLLEQAARLFGESGNGDKREALMVEAAKAAPSAERWREARELCVDNVRLRGQCTTALLALLVGSGAWMDATVLCAEEGVFVFCFVFVR